MWLGAKLTLKKLLYDDSGVAMAYTVLVSLFIFMLCVSTYAMTENIRQKMELQNACDAAAYSGAVVQADMLSRIAVLNRALAWTYAQSSKRHMDYIISDWILNISNTYAQYRDSSLFSNGRTDFSFSKEYSREVTCSTCGGRGSRIDKDGKTVSCPKTETEYKTIVYSPSMTEGGYVSRSAVLGGVVDYCHCFGCGGKHNPSAGITTFDTGYHTAGWFMGWDTHHGINLNRHIAVPNNDVDLSTLTTTRDTVLSDPFMAQLDNSRTNIVTINNAIDYLRRNMNVFISSAIAASMSINADAGRAGNYAWNCGTAKWNSVEAPAYLNEIARDPSITAKEAYFLNYNGHAAAEFRTGVDDWWIDKTDASGIRRGYSQGNDRLVGRFRYWATVWGKDPWTQVCHYLMHTLTGNSPDITPTPGIYSDMPAANPVRLSSDFFGKGGSIVVTAKCAMVNPFAVLFGNDAATGLYGAFNGTDRDMWAISAARAGVNLTGSIGRYETRYPGDDRTGSWNLCEDDWDAVMLPIARAWNDTVAISWGTGTGQSVDDTTRSLLNSARTALGVNTSYSAPVNPYNPFNARADKK